MQQHQYEAIVKCINFGCPAMAQELITAFNNMVAIVNEHTKAQQAANAVNANATKAEEAKDNKKK